MDVGGMQWKASETRCYAILTSGDVVGPHEPSFIRDVYTRAADIPW